MRRVEPCHHGAGRLRGVEAVRAADTVARLEESGARDHVRSIASCWATEVVALPGCGLRALVTVAIFGAGGRSALVSASVRQADWPSLWLSLRGLWSLAGRQDRSRLARRSATVWAGNPAIFGSCETRDPGVRRSRQMSLPPRPKGSDHTPERPRPVRRRAGLCHVRVGGTAQPARVTVPPPGAVQGLPGIRVACQWPSQSINWPAGSLAAPHRAAGICGMPDRETEASCWRLPKVRLSLPTRPTAVAARATMTRPTPIGFVCPWLLGRGPNRGQLSDRAWHRPR